MAADGHLGHTKMAITLQPLCQSTSCAFIHAVLSRLTLALAKLSYSYTEEVLTTQQYLTRKRLRQITEVGMVCVLYVKDLTHYSRHYLPTVYLVAAETSQVSKDTSKLSGGVHTRMQLLLELRR